MPSEQIKDFLQKANRKIFSSGHTLGNSGSEDDSDVDIESVKDEEESGDSDRDEEEKWLDAVESGNVENHVDSELRSIQACPPTHFPILFTFIQYHVIVH